MIRLTILILLCCNLSAVANFYIEGYILDQPTVYPINEAIVSILNSDAFVTTTDATGYFILENIELPIVDIVVSKPGYYVEIVKQVDLINSNNIQIRVALTPNFVELENVVIEAKSVATSNNKTVVDVKKLNKTSGVFDDPSRVLQELPSVRSTNDQANHISIRGNSPNATK